MPAYALTKDEQGTVEGVRTRAVSASMDATAADDLEAITRELWADGPPEWECPGY